MSVPFVAFSIYAGAHPGLGRGASRPPRWTARAAGQRFCGITVPIIRPVHRRSCSCCRSSGTCGSSPRSSCCRTPARSRARPTCSAPTSTNSAQARAISALASAVSIFVLVLTSLISAFYVRSMLKEDDGVHEPRVPLARPCVGGRLGRGIVVALVWLFPVYWMVNSSLLLERACCSRHPDVRADRRLVREFRRASSTAAPFLPALGMSVAIAADRRGRLPVLRVPRRASRSAGSASAGARASCSRCSSMQMLPAEGLFIAQYKLRRRVSTC